MLLGCGHPKPSTGLFQLVNCMKTLLQTIGSFLLAVGYVHAINPHPRIWLTSQMLSDLSSKKANSDPDWIAIKSAADDMVSRKLPKLTIVNATNGNPVQFTTAEPLPWNG